MDRNQVVAFLNSEIAALTSARDSLMSGMNGTGPAPIVRRGRKPGPKSGLSIVAASANTAAPTTKKRSNMSPEGRKRLADAMRARWAARKKATKATATKK
jgi:hypothetical protein